MKFLFAAALLATSNAMEFNTIELDETANTTAPAANTTAPASNTTTAPAANTTSSTNTTTTNGTKGTGDAGKKAAAGADFGTIALIVLGVAVVAGGGFFAYKHFSQKKPEGENAEGAEGGVFEDDLYMKVDVESTLL